MNERDYYLLEYLYLFTGILLFILGSFLLNVFNKGDFITILFLGLIFFIFFFNAVYYNYKRKKYSNMMMKEIKRLLEEIRDEKD